MKKKGSTQVIRRDKGGLNAKIHATVDALGNPIGSHLSGGQACDLDGVDLLLPRIETEIVLAGNGLVADQRVLIPLQKTGKTAVIPPQAIHKVQRNYAL